MAFTKRSGYCYGSRNPILIFYCYGTASAHERWHGREHEPASSVAGDVEASVPLHWEHMEVKSCSWIFINFLIGSCGIPRNVGIVAKTRLKKQFFPINKIIDRSKQISSRFYVG